MPHKTNNYISAKAANELAIQGAYFQRLFPNKGGIFFTDSGVWKVNEQIFKKIQPNLKPRN
ncbi:MAG: hypothetical protein RLZZ605_672 [Bacteroidota bacterium]|jgi:hypothetical protein